MAGRYPCELCERSYRSKECLEDHMREHTGELPFVCKSCGMCFRTQGTFKRHLLSHLENNGKSFTCELCGKAFVSKSDLCSHLRYHTGERTYKCVSCSRQFHTKRDLQRHEMIHRNEKPFVCHLCCSKFRRSTHLKAHMTVHKGTKDHECQKCGNKFSRKEALVGHTKRMHPSADSCTFGCLFCDKRYLRRQLLFAHIGRHTRELPYSCNFCGQEFSSLGNRNRHVKYRHTGERPHSCKFCNMSFVTKPDLMVHTVRMH